jgi:AraC-like DNA-binding protein
MDPLSDILSLLKPRNYLSAGFEAGLPWAIQFPDQQQSIKSGSVISGTCWLSVEGVADPVFLQPGDSFLLPKGRPFRMAGSPDAVPVRAEDIFSASRTGGIVVHNGGGDFSSVSSRFALDGPHAQLLLGVLPPIVHIRNSAETSAMRWSMERMMQELRQQRPGGQLVIRQLAHVMLVQALRLHLSDSAKGVGWLFALGDRQIGGALSAMHEAPARRWTLQSLAETAGMSRSTFALRFKETVGETPLDYLTRWRMLLAAERLRHSDDAVSAISLSLGYESESAFSTAFKRVMGCPPRQYARAQDRFDAPEPAANFG